MRINLDDARAVLLSEADAALKGNVDASWQQGIENFSRICDESTKTHIAFLGTAILARSTDVAVDVWAVKAKGNHPGAYSARGLGHGVLVTHAPALGINLGVTGREPLNNQPYFQIDRVSRETTVHGSARAALNALCDLLERLSRTTTVHQARSALRAFVFVRRQWNPNYGSLTNVAVGLAPDDLIAIVREFVKENSEGGKRAQAVVAGLMDLFAGAARVVTSRVNDPDRHLPGDVGLRSVPAVGIWEKIFEVRDKVVREPDLYHFAQKALEHGVAEAAVVAIAPDQPPISTQSIRAWSADRGVCLTVFCGWEQLILQVLFWSETTAPVGVQKLAALVLTRLKELEVSERGVELWVQKMSDSASLSD